jgi:hypothetical protein
MRDAIQAKAMRPDSSRPFPTRSTCHVPLSSLGLRAASVVAQTCSADFQVCFMLRERCVLSRLGSERSEKPDNLRYDDGA